MIQDFALDQDSWLDENVQDIDARKGVCHAISIDWVFAQLTQSRAWDVQTEYWRAVSHQRAYALTWQESLRGYWASKHYNTYLQIALPPTEKFVRDLARRKGREFHTYHLNYLYQLSSYILALPACAGLVITIFGSSRDSPADVQNWGHTVAMARDGRGMYRLLDINEGQYSWSLATPASTVGRDVERNLYVNYGSTGIRNIYIFRVG
ncbi:hypothetical protein ACMV5I_29360 [Serratia sp. T13T92]|uniref:hypothetical protein n=1 Tax=Serratia sp. T13T92 TaxID=3397496 RepID=UPI0039E01C5B